MSYPMPNLGHYLNDSPPTASPYQGRWLRAGGRSPTGWSAAHISDAAISRAIDKRFGLAPYLCTPSAPADSRP